MEIEKKVFLDRYPENVKQMIDKTTILIKRIMPAIEEELDFNAKIIGYGFGRNYSDTICTIIPSQKGVKLGFYKGSDLHDPERLLEGKGKIHKFVDIKSEEVLNSKGLKDLIFEAYKAHEGRKSK